MKRRFEFSDLPDNATDASAADRLEEVIIRLPCYEPTGFTVNLTRRDLCSHVLALGQTGSGKTTSLCRWMIKQLIQHRADDPNQRAGVFVCDFNGDDTLSLVTKWAKEVGRAADLRVLSVERGHLDLFAGMEQPDRLSTATSLLMTGAWANLRNENAYWVETAKNLLDAGLTACLTVEGRLSFKTVLRFLTGWLVAHRLDPADEALVASFRQLCQHADECNDANVASKLRLVLTTFDMWAKLDPRTKGILSSMILDAVGPLMAPETHRYLNLTRPPAFEPESLADGLIMVFSMPAARQLESAALLGRVLKSRLWSSLQARSQNLDSRLCAVVADEYHLLASGGNTRASDVTALATLRSRSVAVIAATQSLDHMASVMSPEQFRSLLPNFGNHFFFRSVEASTADFATGLMGTHDVERRPKSSYQTKPRKAKSVLICPPAALTVLHPCQAYVSLASGYRSPEPLWLGANHERPDSTLSLSKTAAAHERNPLTILRHSVFGTGAPPLLTDSGSSLVKSRKLEQGNLFYDQDTWQLLLIQPRFQRCHFMSYGDFRDALFAFGQKPAGLETLPPCWWQSIVRLTKGFEFWEKAALLGLHQIDGCLKVTASSNGAAPEKILAWIVTLEKSLYPVRSRPLKVRDLTFITTETHFHPSDPETGDEDST